jgi:hypothetical protein
VGLFVIYSKQLPWTQALAVSSGMSLVISIVLLGVEMAALFIVLFSIALALSRVVHAK